MVNRDPYIIHLNTALYMAVSLYSGGKKQHVSNGQNVSSSFDTDPSGRAPIALPGWQVYLQVDSSWVHLKDQVPGDSSWFTLRTKCREHTRGCSTLPICPSDFQGWFEEPDGLANK